VVAIGVERSSEVGESVFNADLLGTSGWLYGNCRYAVACHPLCKLSFSYIKMDKIQNVTLCKHKCPISYILITIIQVLINIEKCEHILASIYKQYKSFINDQ
jgi:hypothetical protein